MRVVNELLHTGATIADDTCHSPASQHFGQEFDKYMVRESTSPLLFENIFVEFPFSMCRFDFEFKAILRKVVKTALNVGRS